MNASSEQYFFQFIPLERESREETWYFKRNRNNGSVVDAKYSRTLIVEEKYILKIIGIEDLKPSIS